MKHGECRLELVRFYSRNNVPTSQNYSTRDECLDHYHIESSNVGKYCR